MNGLWLAFIGWFLQNAAASVSHQVNLQARLRGTTVAQVMSRDCAQVPGLVTLNQIVQDHVLTNGQHCFFVVDFNGQPVGVLTLQDITRHPQMQWRFIAAREVMTPLHKLSQVDPDTELIYALQKMEDENLNQMTVVDAYGPVGILSRENVIRFMQFRSKLGS